MKAITYLWPLLISWILKSSGIAHEPTRCGMGPGIVFLGEMLFGVIAVVAIGCVIFFLIFLFTCGSDKIQTECFKKAQSP